MFIKYNIPNGIIYIILDYKNSIVIMEDDHDESENEKDVLIDTYGKSFDYYPKY